VKRSTAIALALGLGLALFAGTAAASGPSGGAVDAAGLSKVRAYAANAGLSKDWQDFFVLVAYRESKGKNLVGLGHDSGAPPYIHLNHGEGEAVAAGRAYDRNADQYAGCWPRSVYTWGSGGWFGILPANGLEVFDDTAWVCLHPWTVTDPAISLVMAIGMARRLMGWDSFDGTVLSLRVGWGDPSSMGDADVLAAKRPAYAADAKAAGLSVTFLDRQLTKPPLADPAALALSLGANLETWMPGA